MHRISKDSQAYFFTVVTKDRLPVFRTEPLALVACAAMSDARKSGGFAIYAYVVMPDHIHVITDSARKPSDILRFLNGIMARKVIDHLKAKNYESSLRKLMRDSGNDDHKYSLWEHHNNTYPITSEGALMQKVNYIHKNPVADGVCERAEDYKFSSARFWMRKPLLDDEPMEVDIKKIDWHS
jgi:REP element-mobilizing transposase RayT